MQVLPTEKAMQLLREGKAGSGDFSAADAASKKLLRSLMEKRAEAKQETSGQAFYGEPILSIALYDNIALQSTGDMISRRVQDYR